MIIIKRALVVLSIIILIGIATDYIPKEIGGYPSVILPIAALVLALFIGLFGIAGFGRCQ